MKAKKLIALLLSLSFIFAMAAPASALNDEEYPIVYLMGTGEAIYDAQGNKIFPVNNDYGALISDTFLPLLKELIIGAMSGSYEKYADKFCEAWYPLFEGYALDPNGESSDGSHINWSVETADYPQKTSDFKISDYRFRYDWRLSPIDIANDLERYIDKVLEVTGKSKVHLISRCFGSNIVAAYLEKHFDHASEKVASVAYYTPSILGVASLSACFSGNFTLDEEAVNNFAAYYLTNKDLIEDPVTKEVVVALIDLITWAQLMGLVTSAATALVDEIKGDLFPKLLYRTLATLPCYWSMVAPEEYENAREFIFADHKEEYAGLIAKTDDFHYTVQLKNDETIKNLQAKGVKFYNFVKYNFPNFPLYEDSHQQSDGCTSVTRQSFGAVASDFGYTLDKKYINSLSTDKYLSPDHTIDASTCLLPETTWFIRDLYHDQFPGSVHDVILDIIKNDMTVSSGKYTQYLQYDVQTKALSNIEETEAEPPATSSIRKFFDSLVRFIKALFNFLKNQIEKKADTAPAA
ncbi:MAG: hypothetical protein PUC33_08860 [Oscillospiraceae bacterium]|nr:hypothetical protein [Oscillospiraceae bacterium]